MFYIIVTLKAPYIFAWRYWMRVPKRRQNLGNLLWLASTWNCNRNVLIVTQYSKLLFTFKIVIATFFHDNFSSSKTSSRRFREHLARLDILCLGRQEISKLKMSSRRLGDQKMFAGCNCCWSYRSRNFQFFTRKLKKVYQICSSENTN